MTTEINECAVEREDSIPVDLSPIAFQAIAALSQRHGWPDLQKHIEPPDLLMLIERLKKTIDSENVFPSGKSATIQHLQHLFERGFWK